MNWTQGFASLVDATKLVSVSRAHRSMRGVLGYILRQEGRDCPAPEHIQGMSEPIL